MANNAYNVCKILRRHNYDAHLILNPYDTFIMSHPIWEDYDFNVETEVLMTSGQTNRLLLEKIAELDWNPPDWVHVIDCDDWLTIGGKKRLFAGLASNPRLTLNAIHRAGLSRPTISHVLRNLPLIAHVSEFDFIAAYGIETVLANFSGVRYAAIPYGADLTIVPFENNLQAAMQRESYAKACQVLPGDPDFIECLRRLSLSSQWTYFPCPIDVEKYRPSDRSSDLPDEYEPNKSVFFMPSRQDFHWKGTDKALKAFLKLSKQRDDIKLVMPGWGADTPRALQLIKEANALKQVTLLPYAVSKASLIRFHNAAYAILDQFALGSYGTSTLEAMACGKAVITHINADKYRAHLQSLPTNLQASTEHEIFENMKWAIENPDRVAAIGRSSREWVIKQHYVEPIETLGELIDSDR